MKINDYPINVPIDIKFYEGTDHEVNGTIKAVKSNGEDCDKCALYRVYCSHVVCCGKDRKDNTDVIFIKVEQQ